MKSLLRNLFVVTFLIVSKTFAAEINTQELKNQLQALVNLSDSLKDAS